MANKKLKKEDFSLLDEVIELKFGKGAKNDPKRRKAIVEYLEDLYFELMDVVEIVDDDDDDEEEEQKPRPPHFDKEMISTINTEDTPDEMIPFVVVRKEKTTVDVKCPHCGDESKVFLSKFRGSQYDEYDCPKCKKKSLAKLDFDPVLKIYVAAK